MKKILVMLLMIPAIARAEFWSGNDLYNRIMSSEMTDRIQALGYVIGVYDMGIRAAFCPPSESGITAGQIRDMTRQYLENNPSQRQDRKSVV